MPRFIECPIRRQFVADRGFYRALDRLVPMIAAGASAQCVALFIRRQRVSVSMRLSWFVEDKSEDGTFAAAVFDILCNG